MKKAVILACALAFISAVGSALTPSAASLTDETLAMILGNSGATGSCPTPWADQNEVVLAARRLGMAKSCSAQITCWDGSSLSCSNPGSGTCASTQSNCSSGVRGSINCGSIIFCPPCPCGSMFCCQCESTGDCVSCCHCSGFSLRQCTQSCSGG